MNIKITADSTCDLSKELMEENNIEILPLYVVKDGASYRDGLEITPQDIFDFVAQGNDPCKTAAVSEADYADCFSRLSSQYDAVIHINISAEFSSCYQNACLAARQFSNVYPVDSRNLSTGSGHVVMGGGPPGEHGTGCRGYCPAASGIGWPGRGQLFDRQSGVSV